MPQQAVRQATSWPRFHRLRLTMKVLYHCAAARASQCGSTVRQADSQATTRATSCSSCPPVQSRRSRSSPTHRPSTHPRVQPASSTLSSSATARPDIMVAYRAVWTQDWVTMPVATSTTAAASSMHMQASTTATCDSRTRALPTQNTLVQTSTRNRQTSAATTPTTYSAVQA